MKPIIYDNSYSLSKPYADIRLRNYGTPQEYRDGHYYSELGMVEIYSEVTRTVLKVCYNGRTYWRDIRDISYTNRGLSIMAGKFQREIINGEK